MDSAKLRAWLRISTHQSLSAPAASCAALLESRSSPPSCLFKPISRFNMTQGPRRPDPSSSPHDADPPPASGDAHAENRADKPAPEGLAQDTGWRLDPEHFPRRLELRLPERILRQLDLIAELTGRDRDEIALSLIDQQLRRTDGDRPLE